MIKYIIKKILYGILVLWGVVTVLFFLFNVNPSEIARNKAGKNPTPELIAEIERELNLDLPVYKQYMLYLNDLSPISIHNESVSKSRIYLDDEEYSYTKLFSFSENRTLVIKSPHLRRDYQRDQKVMERIDAHLPETLILAGAAIVIAIFLGITLGIISGLYKGTFIDQSSIVISTLGMSAPSFVMAVIIQWIFANQWYDESSVPILPFLGVLVGGLLGFALNKRVAKERFVNFSWVYMGEMMFKGGIISSVIWLVGYALMGLDVSIPLIDNYIVFPGTELPNQGTFYASDELGDPYIDYYALVLPAITLGIRPLAVIMQLTRSSMLDVMSQDYVRTAKAKGLNPFWVLIKHTLKNALNPVITAISGYFAGMFAGAIFVEQIFNWNGIGNVLYDAVVNDNMPLVIGATIFIAAGFVIINVIVDIVYGLIDPRVRIR